MNECDLEAEEARARCVVDQLGALVRKLPQSSNQVLDLVGDVMHPGASFCKELSDECLVAERGEQLDTTLPEAQGRRFDALLLHDGPVLDVRPEQALVGSNGLVEVVDGNSEVMDP